MNGEALMVFKFVARGTKIKTLIVGIGGLTFSLKKKKEKRKPEASGRRQEGWNMEQAFEEGLAVGADAEKNGRGLGRVGEETGRHS